METMQMKAARTIVALSAIHSAALGTSIDDIRNRLGEGDFTEDFYRRLINP